MLANTKKWRANSWWLGPISQHLANEEHFHWKTHSSDRLLRHYYHTCPGDVPSTMHMAGACLKMHLSNQFHCPVLQHHLQKPQLIHRAKCSNQDHQLLPFFVYGIQWSQNIILYNARFLLTPNHDVPETGGPPKATLVQFYLQEKSPHTIYHSFCRGS